MTDTLDLPTRYDAELASLAVRQFATALKHNASGTLAICTDSERESNIVLPRRAAQLLVELLAQMASGNAVRLVPIHAQLTTQQAAEILNVSRPFLIKLLESGELPYELVGTHRRLRTEDVFAYRKRRERQSQRALAKLAELDQEFGIG